MNQITRIAQIKTSVPLCEKIVLLCASAPLREKISTPLRLGAFALKLQQTKRSL
jgi:hypothetical protein